MQRLLFTIFIVAGCARSTERAVLDGQAGPTLQGPPELAYCATPLAVTNGVHVSGTASFVRREVWGNEMRGGLGSARTTGVAHPATVHPIRQAEVRVTDRTGAVVQCGSTADDGTFNVLLPRGDYQLAINSRSLSDVLKASVLDQPESNQVYALTTLVDTTSTLAPLALTAAADGDTLAGAFNILDQIYAANVYLHGQVGNCAATFSGCQDVTALPKVSAYWMRGFNPNAYFGSMSPLSFYLPGYARLFILGGVDGDSDRSDTDHFDNAVIVHEYGHFMEDAIGRSDSPGGPHNGNGVIDPRLAWSEGWGDFIQAAVRGDPHYVDSIGNDDGTTELAYYTELESAEYGFDYPEFAGEGVFREFSVTRLLWDVIDTNSDTQFGATDYVSGKFAEIWAAFSSTTTGFRSPQYAFRNIGLLSAVQSRLPAASDWSALRAMERQGPQSFAPRLTTNGCGTGAFSVGGNAYQFATVDNSVGFVDDYGALENSDLFRNNAFFALTAGTSGTHQITLRYQDADGLDDEANLDLYLYAENFRFADLRSAVGVAQTTKSGRVDSVEPDENLRATMVGGANYLLNVNVNTGAQLGTQAYYNIYIDGRLLCPAP